MTHPSTFIVNILRTKMSQATRKYSQRKGLWQKQMANIYMSGGEERDYGMSGVRDEGVPGDEEIQPSQGAVA